MTIADIQSFAASHSVSLTVELGRIVIDGPDDAVDALIPLVREWKPELVHVLSGDAVADVGQCANCKAGLLGLPTSLADFTNRVCPACGTWHPCLPPGQTHEDIDELIEERCGIMEHNGRMSREVANREGFESVRQHLEEQKSIFDATQRIK